jgi:hypothetical protein
LILLLMLYLLRKSVKRSLSVGPGQNHVPAWLTLAHAGIYCWDHQDIENERRSVKVDTPNSRWG